MRLAGVAEVEQQKLVCGLVLKPDRELHVVVKNLASGHRLKLYSYVQLPKGFDTDQTESEVQDFWDMAAEWYPEINKIDAAMRT